ncbi:hypothetical protein C8Q78DRAFT_198943 [Trametes maxima]|nr:hypothetical protein C8Q78DRAFT_198943 [Trametes maxima]
MTQPSGFGSTARKPKPAKAAGPVTLPLLAVSMGCESLLDESSPDRLWLRVESPETDQTHLLKIVRSPSGSELVREFNIGRDFNAFKFASAEGALIADSSIIIQLQTTSPGGRPKPGLFQPGNTRFPGQVTFKFAPAHTDWSRTAYDALLTCLRQHIGKRELLKPPAPAKCWETVVRAQQHKEKELERTANSPGRSARAVTEVSSASAGPSNVTSIAMTTDEQETARTSLTPENLDELVLVYPPSGTGAVNITRGDLKRLDNGQYLNDTLIEFGLKVWLNNLRRRQPELAEQVHVFNSFFYKKLNAKKDISEAYPSVRKWTSKVDIFSKKYIIVPINEKYAFASVRSYCVQETSYLPLAFIGTSQSSSTP